MLGIALALLLAPAPTVAPPIGPANHAVDVRVGPVTFAQYSELRWPGLYAPTFDLVPDPRWMHVFSMRLNAPRWSWLSMEARFIEPARDASLRSAVMRMPTPERNGAVWLGVRADIRGTPWQVQVGRTWRTRGMQGSGGPRLPFGAGGVPMIGLSRGLR